MARTGRYNADPEGYHLASEYVTARKEGANSLTLDEYVRLVKSIGKGACSFGREPSLDEEIDNMFEGISGV